MKIDESLRDVALGFIASNPLAVLSLNQKHEAPYATPVFVLGDNQLNLTFVTKVKTHKYELLSHDNRVAITIHNAHKQQVLQATGEANAIGSGEGEAQKFFDQVNSLEEPSDANWMPPIVKIDAGEYAIFKIETDWMQITHFNSHISGPPTVLQVII
jgi:nitroimidazol reductase NimA-like FMN-containing flavoprotein (pyridoxamine 5'-phosphate oxidase superfamily)